MTLQVKLTYFQLDDWQFYHEPQREVVPGIRVCPTSRSKTLGVIVGVGPKVKRESYYKDITYVDIVTVFWLTGSRKGTRQEKRTKDLINYDAFKASIYQHLKEYEDNEALAAQTGM